VQQSAEFLLGGGAVLTDGTGIHAGDNGGESTPPL
jgi:hypothetical protein